MAKKPAKKPEDDAKPAGEGGDAPAPKGIKALLANKKLLMMAGGGVVALLLVGGGAAYFLGVFSPRPQPQQQQQAQGVAPQEPARPRPHFMEVPEITVNLASNAQRAQFLRLKLSLELPDQASATQIQPLMPRILDAFQVYLREMRPSDLEGSASVHRIREELTRRVNLAVAPARVDAILFREMLVQ